MCFWVCVYMTACVWMKSVHVWIAPAVPMWVWSAAQLCVSVSLSASVGSCGLFLSVLDRWRPTDTTLLSWKYQPVPPPSLPLLLCLPPPSSPAFPVGSAFGIATSSPPHCPPLHHQTTLKSLFRSDNELSVCVGVYIILCEGFLLLASRLGQLMWCAEYRYDAASLQGFFSRHCVHWLSLQSLCVSKDYKNLVVWVFSWQAIQECLLPSRQTTEQLLFSDCDTPEFAWNYFWKSFNGLLII